MSRKFDPFQPTIWRLAHDQSLLLGPKALIMGVLNVTPDSFSDGGKYSLLDSAIRRAHKMKNQGADIIDIGGESTRPGASPLNPIDEQRRILPIIEQLTKDGGFILSVDTYRADTAEAAIRSGAHIINDIWGFQKDPAMAMVAGKHYTGCVLMHSGRDRPILPDIIDDQLMYLKQSVAIAEKAKLKREQLVLDPGFGFAKETISMNLQLLDRMGELFEMGFPILTGTSRKRFVSSLTGKADIRRDVGTVATSVVARMKGSAVFRVHDVQKNRDALNVVDALLAEKGNSLQ